MVITMQLIINKGGAMKLPSLRSIERTLKMIPMVKDMLPINNNNSDSELSRLIKLVKQQEDTIYAKKQEIAVLKKKVEDLEGIYKSLKRRTWELEENLETCNYELNILNNAINNSGG